MFVLFYVYRNFRRYVDLFMITFSLNILIWGSINKVKGRQSNIYKAD